MEIVDLKIKTIELLKKKNLKKLLTVLIIIPHGVLLTVLLVADLQPLSYET